MAQDVYEKSTWYEATAKRGEMDGFPAAGKAFDACIIGAGLAGLTTALELSRRRKRVVVLEAKWIGAGASGRNGGFVSNGFALGVDAIVSRFGLQAAQGLYALSRQGTEFVRAEIAAADPSIKMGDGWILAVRHNDGGRLKSYGEMLNRDFGETLQQLSSSELRMLLDTPRYHAGFRSTSAFHIHPLRYCLMIAEAARALGASIAEGVRALSVEKNGATFVVKTGKGDIHSEHVVHCVSSLDRNLHRVSGRAVLPVATYIGVTEPLQQTAIKTASAVSDTRRAGDYYRLLPGQRILWGGRITTRVSPPGRLAERMKRDMLSTYPQLGNPQMEHAWAGLMGYAIHKMPLIGRDAEGQWFATAFGGHGLNTTAMAGLLIARGVAEGDDAYRRFKDFAPDYAFGPLGRIGVQGSYWWMQAQDRWDESRGTGP